MNPTDDREAALKELEALALEGLNSGEPVEAGPEYWERLHRELDEALDRKRNQEEQK